MHFVQKGKAPEYFIKATSTFDSDTQWNEFQNPEKTQTKQHILKDEQQGLCIYCERDVEEDKTRLEHIKPQKRYPKLRFNYNNLVISCSGKDYCSNEIQAHQGFDIDSCDHYKDKHYDETQFLDPTQEQQIADYFYFDYDTGAINACSFEESANKAKYMIDLLNLDNPSLRNERINAKRALLKNLYKQPKVQWKNKLDLLLKNNRAYISFLKKYRLTLG
ncbi:MAG: TIGR02646 family protein [Methylococcales bacterium]|nr:TIGR02646 family protein [Methylococcales bacterium]